MRQKILRRRIVILPPFMHKTFRYPRFFETPKGSPRSFSVQWDKKIDRIVIPYYRKIFRYQNISGRQTFFYEYFRYCGTNRIDRIVIPYYRKIFRYQNISERQTFFYEYFRYCGTNRIDKVVIPLLSKKSLIPEHFWYTGGFSQDVFRRFGTKKLRRKNVTPPFLSIKFFRTSKLLKDKSLPPRRFSVLWDKNNRQKKDTTIIQKIMKP